MNYERNNNKRMMQIARDKPKTVKPFNAIAHWIWEQRNAADIWALALVMSFIFGMMLASCSGYVNGL